MQDVETILNQNYLDNMEFFKQNYLEVYQQIREFESKNEENYYLNIVEDHFDIVDKNEKPFYNCDPFFDAEHRTQNINNNISGLSWLDLKKSKEINNDPYDSAKFLNQLKKISQNKEVTTNKYNKLIFVGTLLGIHLNQIDQIVNCETYLIVEKDIEIFRLSLFFTNYFMLSQNSELFFAIDQSNIELQNSIQNFLNYLNDDNYFIKFEIASEKEIHLFEDITNIFSSLNPSIYPYSETVRSLTNGLENFTKSKNGILKLHNKEDILSSHNLLFLGSGPSLYKNIDFIKNNQNKFIIVAALSSLKRLEKEGVLPDIIISIDGNQSVIDDIKVSKEYYEDSIILTSINTNKAVFDTLNHNKTFLIQNSIELFNECGTYTGVTVGDIGVKLLVQLGAKSIYLCGIDAALDQEDGKTHDSTHVSSENKKLENSSLLKDSNNDFANKVITVKGNFQESVYTTLYYKMIIDQFNKNSNSFRNINIYNLSDGAYLEGTTPTKIEDIKIEELEVKELDLIESLYNSLVTITKNNLDEKDIQYLKRELNSIEDYKNNLDIEKDTILASIISNYYHLISPYSQIILNNNPELEDKVLRTLKNQVDMILLSIKTTLSIILKDK